MIKMPPTEYLSTIGEIYMHLWLETIGKQDGCDENTKKSYEKLIHKSQKGHTYSLAIREHARGATVEGMINYDDGLKHWWIPVGELLLIFKVHKGEFEIGIFESDYSESDRTEKLDQIIKQILSE